MSHITYPSDLTIAYLYSKGSDERLKAQDAEKKGYSLSLISRPFEASQLPSSGQEPQTINFWSLLICGTTHEKYTSNEVLGASM